MIDSPRHDLASHISWRILSLSASRPPGVHRILAAVTVSEAKIKRLPSLRVT